MLCMRFNCRHCRHGFRKRMLIAMEVTEVVQIAGASFGLKLQLGI